MKWNNARNIPVLFCVLIIIITIHNYYYRINTIVKKLSEFSTFFLQTLEILEQVYPFHGSQLSTQLRCSVTLTIKNYSNYFFTY